MSEQLWKDNLALWQSQDKMNELHSKRIDELTKLVKLLSEIVKTQAAIDTLAIASKSTCGGKHCSCKGN